MTVKSSERVVLVAGGTGGLGRAVSLAFLADGARVVATCRALKELAALKKAAGAQQALLEGAPVDVTDGPAAEAFVDAILARHGRLDAMVNAVGGYAGGVKLWETPPEIFNRMLDLNLRSGYTLARAVVPAMVRQGHGAIVNVAAKAALDHGAGAGAYAASKAAAVAMMDCLAADLRGTGVRVNSVLPSIIDTEANRQAMPGADFAKWPKPEEIAQVILFLCGPGAQLIHGAAVPVFGGN